MTNEPNDLLPCPMCGRPPAFENDFGNSVRCVNPQCPLNGRFMFPKEWNTRSTLTASLPPDIGKFVEMTKKIVQQPCSNPQTVQVRERQYVTREMAMDGGDPALEGTLYCDDEFEQRECGQCSECLFQRALSTITTLSSENERLKKINEAQKAAMKTHYAYQETVSVSKSGDRNLLDAWLAAEAALRALEAKEGGKAETK